MRYEPDIAQLSAHVRAILEILDGANTADKELHDTPRRFAELLADRFITRERTPLKALATSGSASGPVVLRDVPFHALCAHHIVPFFGTAHIAYLPADNIAGFGAFVRLVDQLCRGPQLQERLVVQIADAIDADLQPEGVLVQLNARQMCMEMTGPHDSSHTIVYAARGCYAGPRLPSWARELFPPPNT